MTATNRPSEFSADEQAVLAPFVTDLDAPDFWFTQSARSRQRSVFRAIVGAKKASAGF
jgi:hypothetical protein